MNKKGFTLIELLAVIVILAIIALIATPIILNIISDSKEESNKRSVELYGKAVKQAIAKSQLNGTEVQAGDLSEEFLETVQYSGSEVTCTTNKLYEDGSIYLEGCTVGIDTKEYTYGKKQVTTPTTTTIYRWSEETITIGDIIDPTSYTTDASTLNKRAYLKHVLDSDNKVIESWACAVYGDSRKETCIRGGSPDFYGWAGTGEYDEYDNELPDYEKFTGNALILKGLESEGLSCLFFESSFLCVTDSVALDASDNGYVDNQVDGVGACRVHGDGSSYCESY